MHLKYLQQLLDIALRFLYLSYVLTTKCKRTTKRADRLGITFAALADPTRRAILSRLTKGEASVNELAAPFSKPAGHIAASQGPRARRTDLAQP